MSRFPSRKFLGKQPIKKGLIKRFLILARCTDQGKKKHININKFAGLSRDWVGAKNLFMCFLFWVNPYGGEKHIDIFPPEILGQSRENFVYVFFSLCVFFRCLTEEVLAGWWGESEFPRYEV